MKITILTIYIFFFSEGSSANVMDHEAKTKKGLAGVGLSWPASLD